MSIVEKQFIQYGNGITTDISQIPFDRFSDFVNVVCTLVCHPREGRDPVVNHVVVDSHLLGSGIIGGDVVFDSMVQSITSSSNITATENLTLSFDQIPDNLIHHIIITIPKNTNITITDELHTKEFYGSIVDVIVEEGAMVQYQINPNVNTKTVCRLFRAYVKQGAQITWIEKVQDSNFYKSLFQTYLEEEHAKGYTYGMFVQGDVNQTDIYAATYHLAPHTMSNAMSKGVLRDTAKAVHRSLVHIAPDAHDCEGYERQDTLLLSDGAQINAVPNLEINNNQVKCSHGATTTYIDDEKLFYFLSRGLDKKTAEELFVSGHIAPVIEKCV
jgi:Fe-S cluster assembly scaffold protein SufB